MRTYSNGIALRTKTQTVFVIDGIDEELFLEIAAFLEGADGEQASGCDGYEGPSILIHRNDALYAGLWIHVSGNEQQDIALPREVLKIGKHLRDEAIGHSAVLIEERDPFGTIRLRPFHANIERCSDILIFLVLDQGKV